MQLIQWSRLSLPIRSHVLDSSPLVLLEFKTKKSIHYVWSIPKSNILFCKPDVKFIISILPLKCGVIAKHVDQRRMEGAYLGLSQALEIFFTFNYPTNLNLVQFIPTLQSSFEKISRLITLQLRTKPTISPLQSRSFL